MATPKNYRGRGDLVLLCALLGTLGEIGRGQIHYSVPEESDKGYFVGNISKDLGLESQELAQHGVHIVSRGRRQLFALNPGSGSLVTAGRIDREELCAQSARCLVNINILVEDKGKLWGIEIEITDINDNNPKFQVDNLEVKINEIALPGTRYPLPGAVDPDVGLNSLQSYQLSPNHHFSLDVQTRDDGTISPELVLESALDREEQAAHRLVLVASDGGEPRRSSTLHIRVTVLDTNDNAPVFAQPIYRVKVPENVPPGTRLLTVSASDPDEGTNGEVAYKFWKISEKQSPLFQLNENTGEISTAKSLDYEECAFYDMEIQAE
ncbi:protocadherin gamma-A8-like, partial [Sagmatias obliquidens]|uniref:protocadherin gamma-A8-like n=1 Tax=Sagmatias obliquidens TaxID=3371155 RepID=UPI000F43E9F2